MISHCNEEGIGGIVVNSVRKAFSSLNQLLGWNATPKNYKLMRF